MSPAVPIEIPKDKIDGLKRMVNLGARYPTLYHYTRRESIKELLLSKGLRARPTWAFNDTEEYINGLRVARGQLQRIRKSEKSRTSIASQFFAAYGNARPPVIAVLDNCIDLIGHEVNNCGNPAVKIYVASLSTDCNSEKMLAEYGDCVIRFNFELPTIAYHTPLPFTSSMLSRVSYSETEFRQAVVPLAFCLSAFERPENLKRHKDWLSERTNEQRVIAASAWATERLCLLAPNLKRPEYAYEKEWRLKSAVSTYATDSYPRRAEHSQASHLPQAAAFDGSSPKRYLQKLLSIGDQKMIVSLLRVGQTEADPDLKSWIDSWWASNQSPLRQLLEQLPETWPTPPF